MAEIQDGMPDEPAVLEIGILLGASRGSAAQAECFRKVPGEISQRSAGRAIARGKKHGTLSSRRAALTGTAFPWADAVAHIQAEGSAPQSAPPAYPPQSRCASWKRLSLT